MRPYNVIFVYIEVNKVNRVSVLFVLATGGEFFFPEAA
jgi:hypothetical protein